MNKSAKQLSKRWTRVVSGSGTREAPKSVEMTLGRGDARFAQIVDDIPAFIAIASPEGEIELVNRQALEYFGKTLEELKSSTSDVIHPDDRLRVLPAWRRSIDTGQPYESEYRLRRADGVYRWFHARALPVRDTTSRICRWHILQTDIDDRRRAESLLAAEKRSLEMINRGASLADILNDLCVSIDAQASEALSTILLMEPERQRLWHAAGPRVPRPWLPAISPRPIGPCEGCCGAAAYWKERVIVSDIATDPVWPDEIRDLAIRNGIRAGWSEPILTTEGELLGTFALYSPRPREPTPAELELIVAASHIALIAIARQRSREALRKSEDALHDAEASLTRIARITAMGELVASIGHELNQPLMAIVTNAGASLSWLSSERPQVDLARQAVDRIVRDGLRANDILKSVRSLARRASPEIMHLRVNDVIEEVLGLMRSELRRHDIALETELAPRLEPVMADRVQIQQVILNLVMNGVEAMSAIMDRSRVLRLSTETEGGGAVLIAVTDTGTGLNHAAKDRIFDALFTTKPDGMGMGLAICRSIVEAHGGRIWASPNLPYGSTFRVILPIAAKRDAK